MPLHNTLLLAACSFLILAGCSDSTKTTAEKPVSKAVEQTTVDPRMTLNASHILIGYAGAEDSRATRSKDEALTIARRLATEAQAKGVDFAALAREHSEGPSGPGGGGLGNFQYKEMVEPFSKATSSLPIGGVSDPVESQFGYHVILRNELFVPIENLSASHILIAYKGAVKATVDRSRDEALELAKEVAVKAKKAGHEKFVDLAKEYSDGPRAADGGYLGVFPPNGGPVQAFANATGALEINEISDPVETPFGFHIFLRVPPPRKVRAKQILVEWKEAKQAQQIERTKEEALARATECLNKLKDGGDFAELASEYSDDPSSQFGGDLGTVIERTMAKPFDKTLFQLKVDELSEVVETQFGYHIIYRYE